MEFGWEWFCLQICAGLPVEACAFPQSPLFSLWMAELPSPGGAAVSCQGPAPGLHSQGFPMAPDAPLSARTTHILPLCHAPPFTLIISSRSQELRATLTPLASEVEPCHTCSDGVNPWGGSEWQRSTVLSHKGSADWGTTSWALSHILLFQNGNVLIACFIFMTL